MVTGNDKEFNAEYHFLSRLTSFWDIAVSKECKDGVRDINRIYKPNKSGGSQGFTLIELVLSISIASILLLMVFSFSTLVVNFNRTSMITGRPRQ